MIDNDKSLIIAAIIEALDTSMLELLQNRKPHEMRALLRMRLGDKP